MTTSTDTRAARLAYASDSFLRTIVATDGGRFAQLAQVELQTRYSGDAQALAVAVARLRLAERDARQALAAIPA